MRIKKGALFSLFLSSLAMASPQWLQYHTSPQARDMVGGSSSFHRPEQQKPDVAIPELQTETPLYVKWATPMDPAGHRWMVFDKKNKYGLCNILYFDTNGNGRLDDDAKIEGMQINQYEVEFYKVPVLFDSPDGPVTYHMNVQFYSYNEPSTYVYTMTGCWYEGTVEIDGNKQRIVLVDSNVNGSFDDKSEDFDSDQITIGPEGNQFTAYVGNYLEYKDKLYHLNIARDGAFVELTPAPDVAYGTVVLPKALTTITVGGTNGQYTRQVTDGQIRLPEGSYRVRNWAVNRTDDKGVEWSLQGSYPNPNEPFTVKEDAAASLFKIGEPVFSRIQVYQRDGSLSLNQSLQGQMGERVTLQKANRQAPAPKINIRNKTGQYDRTFSLEYG